MLRFLTTIALIKAIATTVPVAMPRSNVEMPVWPCDCVCCDVDALDAAGSEPPPKAIGCARKSVPEPAQIPNERA